MRKYNNQENEMIRVNEVPQDIVEGLYEGKVPFRLVCLDVSNLNEESMKLLINKHGHDVDWDLTREVFDMTDSVMKNLFVKVSDKTVSNWRSVGKEIV